MEQLTVNELAEIFIMHPEDDGDAVINNSERFFEVCDVLIYFSGLIIVDDWESVRLAHFSIKEYLISGRIQQDLASTFSFSDIDAHNFIAYSCLTYSNYLCTLLNQDNEKIHSLKNYAASKWLFHLEMVPCELWQARVIEKVAQNLAIRSQSLTNAMLKYSGTVDPGVYCEYKYSCMMNSLLRPYWFTAYYGLVRVTEYLLSQAYCGGKYLTQGDLNTALWYAVYKRRKEVAALLLDRGADANTSTTVINIGNSDIFEDVLQMAVSNNDTEMVNLLLDRGADINAQRGGSALQTAAKWRHLDMLKLLVGRGASINAPSNERDCVLLAAACYDDSCFQYLLDNGADVNMSSTGEGKFKALRATALNKKWRLFDLLLERGADVNIGGEGGYPLFYVIAAGDLPRIKQLLSFGADINAKDGHHETALGAVCYSYHEDQKLSIQIAQYLIDNGADVNMSPPVLQRCASNGYTPLARLLLQNGADVNVQGDRGSALQAACVRGNLEMMQLLLDHGADVNAQGGEYGTALHAVCISSGFPDTTERVQALQLLLQHGADVNVWSSKYGPMLQAVCGYSLFDDKSCKSKPVAASLVPILLDNDVDINAQGGEYGTALQAACFWNPDIVQLLLDHGADVNAQGGEYGTALQAACLESPSIVQLLLDHGADLHAIGGKYGTALQAACKSNNLQIARLLLDHGADVHVCSGLYGTAIQAACGAGADGDLIQLLLDRGADVNADGGQYGTALQISCHIDTCWGGGGVK